MSKSTLTITKDTGSNCLFCSEELRNRKIAKYKSVFAVEDGFPVTFKHTLIIPYRHTEDYFTMSSDERRDAEILVDTLRSDLEKKDPSITGFNLGINCGESAGQTVKHAHFHLIPRRDGDMKNPRGGVRGVIPERMDY